jgi:hypothetical protein
MFRRMVRAASLDSAFYETVEADPSTTKEAALVVLLGAVATAVGETLRASPGLVAAFASIIGIFIFWFIWAGLTLLIGTRITRGPETESDMGEMLRVLGYAMSPRILNALGFIPLGIGLVIQTVAFVWCVVTGVVAIRQALDFNTRRAVVTVLLAALVAYGAQWAAQNAHRLLFG